MLGKLLATPNHTKPRENTKLNSFLQDLLKISKKCEFSDLPQILWARPDAHNIVSGRAVYTYIFLHHFLIYSISNSFSLIFLLYSLFL
jgi:hypothetical protein